MQICLERTDVKGRGVNPEHISPFLPPVLLSRLGCSDAFMGKFATEKFRGLSGSACDASCDRPARGGGKTPSRRHCCCSGAPPRLAHSSKSTAPSSDGAEGKHVCPHPWQASSEDGCDVIAHLVPWSAISASLEATRVGALSQRQRDDEVANPHRHVQLQLGDELCQKRDDSGNTSMHIRSGLGPLVAEQMYSSRSSGLGGNGRVYIPLGPHWRFTDSITRVDPGGDRARRLATRRKFLFSFIGARTGGRARHMQAVFDDVADALPTGINAADGANTVAAALKTAAAASAGGQWLIVMQGSTAINQQDPKTVDSDFISPDVYAEVLLESRYTLCPGGYNPESFRFWEACAAGSIPIISPTSRMISGGSPCMHAWEPVIASGAPVIILKEWTDLPAKLAELAADPKGTTRRQQQLRLWHDRFLDRTAFDLEAAVVRSAIHFAPDRAKLPQWLQIAQRCIASRRPKWGAHPLDKAATALAASRQQAQGESAHASTRLVNGIATARTPSNSGGGGGTGKQILFGSHHKCGSTLLKELLMTFKGAAVASGVPPPRLQRPPTARRTFIAGKIDWHLSAATLDRLPPDTPVVHMVRDPVDAVLSGYYYHASTRENADRWVFARGWESGQGPASITGGGNAGRKIQLGIRQQILAPFLPYLSPTAASKRDADSGGESRSFQELLQALDAEHGVLLELVRALAADISEMVDAHALLARHHGKVLTIKLEDFGSAANFNKSMSGVFAFVSGEHSELLPASLLPTVLQLGQKHSTSSSQFSGTKAHISALRPGAGKIKGERARLRLLLLGKGGVTVAGLANLTDNPLRTALDELASARQQLGYVHVDTAAKAADLDKDRRAVAPPMQVITPAGTSRSQTLATQHAATNNHDHDRVGNLQEYDSAFTIATTLLKVLPVAAVIAVASKLGRRRWQR